MIAFLILLALVELLVACRMWITLQALYVRHGRLAKRVLDVENKVKSLRGERA